MKFSLLDQESPYDLFREWYGLVSGENQGLFTKIYMKVLDLMLSKIMPAMNRIHANAMVLSTVGKDGQPNARVVLLKSYDSSGFRFYTNYGSQKGKEIEENSRAALVFYWDFPPRQVRIQGLLKKTSQVDSQEYWSSRPRGSRLSALASHQSQRIPEKSVLEKRVKELELEYHGKEIPCPDFWGGYILEPTYFEFWQGRPNRMHDRFLYQLVDNHWVIKRLSP